MTAFAPEADIIARTVCVAFGPTYTLNYLYGNSPWFHWMELGKGTKF